MIMRKYAITSFEELCIFLVYFLFCFEVQLGLHWAFWAIVIFMCKNVIGAEVCVFPYLYMKIKNKLSVFLMFLDGN